MTCICGIKQITLSLLIKLSYAQLKIIYQVCFFPSSLPAVSIQFFYASKSSCLTGVSILYSFCHSGFYFSTCSLSFASLLHPGVN